VTIAGTGRCFLNGHTATRQTQPIGSFKGPRGVVLGPNFRELFGFFTGSLRTPGGPAPYRCAMQKRRQPLAAVNQSPLPPNRAFVVQLRAAGAAGTELFAGRVEHITSGAAERFASAEGLINFVMRVLASAPAASNPRGAGQAEGHGSKEES
jgi:hypothetical protein